MLLVQLAKYEVRISTEVVDYRRSIDADKTNFANYCGYDFSVRSDGTLVRNHRAHREEVDGKNLCDLCGINVVWWGGWEVTEPNGVRGGCNRD